MADKKITDLTVDTAPIKTDLVEFVKDPGGTPLSRKVTYSNVTKALDFTAPAAKTTPVDADVMPINDSAASDIAKKVTWANIKATLKTYFDTLYAGGGGGKVIITNKQFEGVLPNGTYPFFTVSEGATIANVRWTSSILPTGSNRTLDIRLNGTASTDSIFTSDTAISITTAQGATNGKYTTEGGTIDNGTLAENDILYFVLAGGSTSATADDYIAIETS